MTLHHVHIAEHLFVSLRWEMAERSKPSRGLTSLWMTSVASVFRRRRRKLRWAAFSIPDRCGQIAQKHEIFPFHDVGERERDGERRRENPPSSGSVHRDTDKIRSTTLPIRSIRFSPLSCHFFSGPYLSPSLHYQVIWRNVRDEPKLSWHLFNQTYEANLQ